MRRTFSIISVLVLCLMTTQKVWADDTKTIDLSSMSGSNNLLSTGGQVVFSATGSETVSKATVGDYNVMRSPFGEEGTVRLYPHISGKVKKLEFTSAYVAMPSCGDGSYVKIGKDNSWTNSVTGNMNGYADMVFTNADGIQLNNADDYLEIKLYNSNTSRLCSFFMKGSLKVTYEPTEAVMTHVHDFTFSLNTDGNTLTATCGLGDGLTCELAGSNYQVTTTLTPPVNVTYAANTSHPATLTGIASFMTATGATVGSIDYVNKNTSESLGTQAPTEIGEYTASVTITAGGTTYTLTRDFRVLGFNRINKIYPQLSTDKLSDYADEGELVTITFTSQWGETMTSLTVTGATSGNDITLTSAGTNTYTFTMPGEEVNFSATFTPDADNFAQDGDTYTIKNDNGWGYFCFAVNCDLVPDGFSGKTVKLAANVKSSEMVGTVTLDEITVIGGHPFKGTFDGQDHTLTFNHTATEYYSAPFHYTIGATIKNLHVNGTITGGDNYFIGGLVGYAVDNITIENCRVSTEISTTVNGGAYHGGVIANWYGKDTYRHLCTVTGCVYDGLIYNPDVANVTYLCGGFMGYFSGNNNAFTFTDCLFAPAEYGTGKYALRDFCFTFVYPSNNPTYHMTNCYYTTALGERQGRPSTTATTAPANLGAATTDHGMVDGYENGFLYDGNYYTPKYGDVVVEYVINDWEQANVTINGTGDNLVGVNITEEVDKVTSVTYNRPFTAGQAATVILPFNYECNNSEGGKFYAFKEVTYDDTGQCWVCTMQESGDGTNKVTTLTAHTPYLFMPTGTAMAFPNIGNMTGGAVTLKPTTENDGVYGSATIEDPDNWEFHGSYKGNTWTNPSNDYGFAATSGTEAGGTATIEAGQFVRFTTNAFIKPMRCYLSYIGTSAPAPARGMTHSAATNDLPASITVRLISRSGNMTAVGTLDTRTGELSFEGWYNMEGVRLNEMPTQKGMYINNGKKVIIK